MTKAELKFLKKKADAAYREMLNFPVYNENFYRKKNGLPVVQVSTRKK
jgi:hypothetical protein